MLTLCASLALGLNLGTYHFDRDRDYREFNPGVYALCTRENGTRWVGGAYLNSEDRPSLHAGRIFTTGVVDWEVGIVTGYSRAPVLPLVAPSIKLGKARATLLVPLEKKGGGVHLSWEF